MMKILKRQIAFTFTAKRPFWTQIEKMELIAQEKKHFITEVLDIAEFEY